MARSSQALDRWMALMVRAAGLAAAMTVLAIVLFLLLSVLPLVFSGEILALLRSHWRPFASPPEHGIAPMMAGTLGVALLALALALPASLGICAFAHGLAPPALSRLVLGAVHFMTSIPTVVYAFVAVLLLVPVVRSGFGRGSGYCLLAAALTLSVLILPTIVLLIHVRLREIEPSVRVSCLALGISPAQTILRVLFPCSRRAILGAAALGLCRAIGDTLVALMVAGGAPQYPTSVLDPVRTLTSHIALVLATDWFSPEYRSIAAAGLVLVLSTGLVSLALRRVARVEAPLISEEAWPPGEGTEAAEGAAPRRRGE